MLIFKSIRSPAAFIIKDNEHFKKIRFQNKKAKLSDLLCYIHVCDHSSENYLFQGCTKLQFMRTECIFLRLSTQLQDVLCPALPLQKHPFISMFGHHLSYVYIILVRQVLTLRTGKSILTSTVFTKLVGPAFHLSASSVIKYPISGVH